MEKEVVNAPVLRTHEGIQYSISVSADTMRFTINARSLTSNRQWEGSWRSPLQFFPNSNPTTPLEFYQIFKNPLEKGVTIAYPKEVDDSPDFSITLYAIDFRDAKLSLTMEEVPVIAQSEGNEVEGDHPFPGCAAKIREISVARRTVNIGQPLNWVFFGECCVGKTTFFLRLKDRVFSYPTSTIGLDWHILRQELFNVRIFDTAGCFSDRAFLLNRLVPTAAVVIFFYSTTSSESFRRLSSYIDATLTHAESLLLCVLIGTKTDLQEDRQVSTEMGQDLATSFGAIFFEISNKDDDMCQQAFKKILTRLELKLDFSPQPIAPSQPSDPIQLHKPPVVPKDSNGCCSS